MLNMKVDVYAVFGVKYWAKCVCFLALLIMLNMKVVWREAYGKKWYFWALLVVLGMKVNVDTELDMSMGMHVVLDMDVDLKQTAVGHP